MVGCGLLLEYSTRGRTDSVPCREQEPQYAVLTATALLNKGSRPRTFVRSVVLQSGACEDTPTANPGPAAVTKSPLSEPTDSLIDRFAASFWLHDYAACRFTTLLVSIKSNEKSFSFSSLSLSLCLSVYLWIYLTLSSRVTMQYNNDILKLTDDDDDTANMHCASHSTRARGRVIVRISHPGAHAGKTRRPALEYSTITLPPVLF